MYAVIESGGKQYRVAVGDRVKVESLDLDAGSKLNLEKVLFLAGDDGIKVGAPYLSTQVEATVIGHGRGEKVRIFKLRRRQNSRQRAGHRQNFTELEIISIDGKTAKPADKARQKATPAKDKAEGIEGAETEVPKKAAKTSVTDDSGTKKKATKKKATKKTAAKS